MECSRFGGDNKTFEKVSYHLDADHNIKWQEAIYCHKCWGGIGYFDACTQHGLSNVKTFVTTIQDESIAGSYSEQQLKHGNGKLDLLTIPFKSLTSTRMLRPSG
jgi:hypothetical protein